MEWPRPETKRFFNNKHELQGGLASCAAIFGRQTESQRDRDFQDASKPRELGMHGLLKYAKLQEDEQSAMIQHDLTSPKRKKAAAF